jgi:hypothetical protein
MSVNILKSNDALKIVENFKSVESSVTKNFFDIFGTTGCLLNCKDERTLDLRLYSDKTRQDAKSRKEKKKIAFEHKLQLSEFRESRQAWFTATIIKTSASRGCGSCQILLKIIIAIFFQDLEDLPEQYEYSVAQDFEVRYREAGEEEPIATVQLFQPPGKCRFFDKTNGLNFSRTERTL